MWAWGFEIVDTGKLQPAANDNGGWIRMDALIEIQLEKLARAQRIRLDQTGGIRK